jgi:hypothetical protein
MLWSKPQQALAAVVQAYIIFEIAASSDETATAEKLRSTGLANCLQLIIGRHARVVFVHIACDERGDSDPSYLNQALQRLSRVDGIARATLVSLKQGTD